jgi:hypothetical protein
MVNIAAVVHISGNTGRVVTYPSYTAYYNNIMMTAPPHWRATQTRLRSSFVLCEQGLSAKYNIPLLDLANVCFVFGTISNTTIQMQDEYVRNLVCNVAHPIVVQVKTGNQKTDIISTIHRAFDYEILTSSHANGVSQVSEP